MRFTTSELAGITGGRVSGEEVTVDGVSTDSRSLVVGQLFVPLVGHRDGHAFIPEAIAGGAPAYLTSAEPVPAATAVVVEDTAAGLTKVGAAARRRLTGRVVGITGSVGKTTVKELVAAAIGSTYRTSASTRSFNNEIGVPLTLANAPDDAEVVVVEMGARGPGHIGALCRIARPTIAVVTRVGQAHTEFLGGLDGVAAAKGELVAALPPDGIAVLNADDPRVIAMRERTEAAVLSYGLSGGEVTATHVRLDELARPAFRLHTPSGSIDLSIRLSGHHQVTNALAAVAVGVALGVPLEAAAAGIAGVEPPPSRMKVRRLRNGVVVVDDAYNANPTSVRAALEALAAIPGGRRIAVLGRMAELGAGSDAEHRRIAEEAAAAGIELIAYATAAFGVEPVEGRDGLARRIGRLGPGDVVLVKGSRAAGMERVVEILADPLHTAPVART